MEIKNLIKKEFFSSKQAISLDSVDLNKIAVSNKRKINDTTYKYLCRYLNNDIIQPLCIILSQMNGCIKYVNAGGKNMSFVTDDKEVYEKYNKIWEVVRKLLKLKFTVNPVRDDKYIIAKLKIFNGINRTTFTNNIIPIERNNYNCISAIDIDLEQCKYKLRKRRAVSFIDDEIFDEDSDSDIDSGIDSHNNFSVPDSYVVM